MKAEKWARVARWCMASGVLALTASVAAQPPANRYPDKPVRIVVTFPPGGSADAVVRMITPRLAESLGQPFIVDNRPGAGGNVGLSAVAKASGDGYMLGVGAAGALAANSSLYPVMPFDPVKDFQPVGMLAAIPFVIVGHPSVEAKTLKDVIAVARRAPGSLSIAHGGNGTAMHLSSALLEQMADIKLVEVPYKGSGPAALAVLSNQVPLAVVDLPASLQQIKAGKLVAYAVTGAQRLPMLPDVPTVAEAGLAGYDAVGWFGVVAPAGTPEPILARLNAGFNAALKDPQIQTNMRNLGVEPTPVSPGEFSRYIQSETRKWGQVIRSANIKLD